MLIYLRKFSPYDSISFLNCSFYPSLQFQQAFPENLQVTQPGSRKVNCRSSPLPPSQPLWFLASSLFPSSLSDHLQGPPFLLCLHLQVIMQMFSSSIPSHSSCYPSPQIKQELWESSNQACQRSKRANWAGGLLQIFTLPSLLHIQDPQFHFQLCSALPAVATPYSLASFPGD